MKESIRIQMREQQDGIIPCNQFACVQQRKHHKRIGTRSQLFEILLHRSASPHPTQKKNTTSKKGLEIRDSIGKSGVDIEPHTE